MNVILPRFTDFPCKCVLLPDHFVKVPHADFGHDGLFLVTLEDCRHAVIATHFFANMIDNIQDSILIPPFRILDTFNLSAHHLKSALGVERKHNDRSGRLKFAIGICFTEETRRASQCHGSRIRTTKGGGKSGDELGSLSWSEERGWIRRHNVVSIEIDKQRLLSACFQQRIYVTRSLKESPRFGSRTKNIWTRFLNNICDISEVHNRDIKSRPLVNPATVTNSLGGDSQPRDQPLTSRIYIAG